jgi:hypothetical protein
MTTHEGPKDHPELFPSPPPARCIHIDSVPKELQPYFVARHLIRQSEELWSQPKGAKPLEIEVVADDGSTVQIIDLSPDRHSKLPGYAPANIRGGDHDYIVIGKWRLWRILGAGQRHKGMVPKRVLIAFVRQEALARAGILSYEARAALRELGKGHLTDRILLALMSEEGRRERLEREKKGRGEEWTPQAGALVHDGIGGLGSGGHDDDDDDSISEQ